MTGEGDCDKLGTGELDAALVRVEGLHGSDGEARCGGRRRDESRKVMPRYFFRSRGSQSTWSHGIVTLRSGVAVMTGLL